MIRNLFARFRRPRRRVHATLHDHVNGDALATATFDLTLTDNGWTNTKPIVFEPAATEGTVACARITDSDGNTWDVDFTEGPK